MEIRPAHPADLDALIEIDATIESSSYLHVDRTGQGMAVQWKLEERPLRQKLIDRNRPADELQFILKQIAGGVEEGIAMLAEHDGAMVAQLVAQPQPQHGTMRVIDVRIDFDYRRQGLATAMVYQVIAEARNQELRAVNAEIPANNFPAHQLFSKLGFEIAGLDARRHSNHDLVKEVATIFWYVSLD
jgi:ribosomal protein S18 acetylase RimI-like enzyme